MNVGLLLITHNALGQYLLGTAATILEHDLTNAASIEVPSDCDPDQILAMASAKCRELDQGDGVLVMTDLYGSTPSNIATRLLEENNALVVSGANVPMLIRVLNYASDNLEELAMKACNGARDGVLISARKQIS